MMCDMYVLFSRSMAGVSGGLLAALVSNAGGLGFIAAGHFQDIDKLEAEIQIYSDVVNSAIDARPCIGFIGHSSLKSSQGWDNYEYILRKHKPRAIQFFAPSIVTSPDGDSNVKLAHKYGAKFVAQVGSIPQAKEAIEHKVDAIICQGAEAGGHGLRRELANSTMALSSQVSNLTDIPVIAAGGIVNGKHLASVLCVCDGASIGTRLWASTESLGNKLLQKELIKGNTCDDVVKTSVFDQIENEMKEIKWPHPFDASGALRNDTTKEWENKSRGEISKALQSTDLLDRYKVAIGRNDTAVVTNYSGEGVGEINSIESAYELVLQMEIDAISTIQRLQGIIRGS
jgi:nitronate monooxygenase